jgi:4-hydroxy-4-methyl-2-oxoglutarate aldolase
MASSAERSAVNAPVVIGGRLVTPGDLIIGDDHGLVALSPASIRSRVKDAQAKIVLEADWKESLASGRSAADTFGLRSVERQS